MSYTANANNSTELPNDITPSEGYSNTWKITGMPAQSTRVDIITHFGENGLQQVVDEINYLLDKFDADEDSSATSGYLSQTSTNKLQFTSTGKATIGKNYQTLQQLKTYLSPLLEADLVNKTTEIETALTKISDALEDMTGVYIAGVLGYLLYNITEQKVITNDNGSTTTRYKLGTKSYTTYYNDRKFLWTNWGLSEVGSSDSYSSDESYYIIQPFYSNDTIYYLTEHLDDDGNSYYTFDDLSAGTAYSLSTENTDTWKSYFYPTWGSTTQLNSFICLQKGTERNQLNEDYWEEVLSYYKDYFFKQSTVDSNYVFTKFTSRDDFNKTDMAFLPIYLNLSETTTAQKTSILSADDGDEDTDTSLSNIYAALLRSSVPVYVKNTRLTPSLITLGFCGGTADDSYIRDSSVDLTPYEDETEGKYILYLLKNEENVQTDSDSTGTYSYTLNPFKIGTETKQSSYTSDLITLIKDAINNYYSSSSSSSSSDSAESHFLLGNNASYNYFWEQNNSDTTNRDFSFYTIGGETLLATPDTSGETRILTSDKTSVKYHIDLNESASTGGDPLISGAYFGTNGIRFNNWRNDDDDKANLFNYLKFNINESTRPELNLQWDRTLISSSVEAGKDTLWTEDGESIADFTNNNIRYNTILNGQSLLLNVGFAKTNTTTVTGDPTPQATHHTNGETTIMMQSKYSRFGVDIGKDGYISFGQWNTWTENGNANMVSSTSNSNPAGSDFQDKYVIQRKHKIAGFGQGKKSNSEIKYTALTISNDHDPTLIAERRLAAALSGEDTSTTESTRNEGFFMAFAKSSDKTDYKSAFGGNVYLNNGKYLYSKDSDYVGRTLIGLNDKKYMIAVGGQTTTDTKTKKEVPAMSIQIGSTSGTKTINLIASTIQYKGSTMKISTSDKNLKENIQDLSDKYHTLFEQLVPKTYNFILDDEKQTRLGFIAQDVEQAALAAGINDFDGVSYIDLKEKEYIIDEQTGKEIEDPNSEVNYLLNKGIDRQYFVSIESFIPLLVNEIKLLRKEINDLKEGK